MHSIWHWELLYTHSSKITLLNGRIGICFQKHSTKRCNIIQWTGGGDVLLDSGVLVL